ncbi:ABC transporter ATP-binding protein [Vulcanisaeta souniana]|uniref:ABC transporter ATP-binding protein n=1 Tax=Vulcanisaeta souniana JCM 11219 TaxID=1293586 RepID=A0A830EG15_9CREN|nr:ABC transporter ATP-binding protein [Vulcanisaeta souniana]BDR92108.1 ABC transporter ATP-binding protein [Vulcanisaeta souniana JCM 11219]GGI67824.1 ABC transporter ATP-binding protein [Vulcanisaeta souniana JCM 11219]
MQAIMASKLRRSFGGRDVLRGVDLDVDYGVIATLLGPNGAGKTTLIRILTTELMPHGGDAYVAGFDVVRHASEVRRRIAVIPQDAKPISYMTPHEFVYSYLLLRGLPRNDAGKAARDSLEELGLWELRNTPIYQLSGGMSRRVLVAAVLASSAEVIFLDEPTVGLDAASRRVVWNSLRRYSNDGATVFLTTHYIDEAEQISDVVYLIDNGLIISRGRPRELVERLPGKYVVEYPVSAGIDSCIRIGSSCFSFVNSLDEVGDGAIRVSPKSLEHYVLVTIKSWGEENEED